MIQLKRILCAVDLSALSTRPIAYATAIARWYAGRVVVLHVVPTFEPMEVRTGALFDQVHFVYPPPKDQLLAQIREMVTSASGDVSSVEVAAEAGTPAATIVDQAVATSADLVVMATHGRSGFNRLMLGSVSERVLRTAPCPVLTVPPGASESRDAVAVRHVLCPIDFSPASLQALGFAVDVARHANASLTVLQVIEWLTEEEPLQLAPFDVEAFRAAMVKETRDRLGALVAEQPRVDRGATSVVGTGRAYREILRLAEEQSVDLIVMGAQGRGGPALTLFGSTTQQVVRAASCPVLTVRAALTDM